MFKKTKQKQRLLKELILAAYLAVF